MVSNNIMWSKSKYKCFKQCPLNFKYSYIEKIPVKKIHADLDKGVKLHSVFDEFYEHYDETKTIKEIMDYVINKHELTPEFIEKYNKHIVNFIEFNENKLKTINKKYFKPVYKELKMSLNNWHGIIDRIDYIDDKWILIDYKTSDGSTLDDYLEELCIYSWMFKELYGHQISYIGILFTGNNKLILEPITPEDIDIVMKAINLDILSFENKINNNDLKPNLGFHCKWCSYQDLCPVYKKVGL